MQINSINNFNYKLTGKPNVCFGSYNSNSSSNSDYTITKKANKTDIGIGIACALGMGTIIASLKRHTPPSIVPKSLEIIGGALNAGFLGLIMSNILRKSGESDK